MKRIRLTYLQESKGHIDIHMSPSIYKRFYDQWANAHNGYHQKNASIKIIGNKGKTLFHQNHRTIREEFCRGIVLLPASMDRL